MLPTNLRRFAQPNSVPPDLPPAGGSSPTPASKRTLPYMQYLTRLSQRTGTPLPSLLVSFGILHELTAVLPLFGFFFASRWLGIGQTTIDGASHSEGWAGETMRRWTKEGGEMAERVGSRYGLFGFPKLDKEGRARLREEQRARREGGQGAERVGTEIAGDVANVVVAYGLTKAILPVRIGLSLYLSPWFSRAAVEPVRKTIWRVFARKDRPSV